ncbi:4-alpha-glucanotransferase [Methylotuvimicrobium sp. KM2]|uniref:4-alpha-glucanotransferase n=1 Tax=Methylotuvimicrobium sp. KM2 TaxID=3133976 RepID=UPI00310129C2
MIDILHRRRAGILLHITSLPGNSDNGNLGPEAYRFVDFLNSVGVTVWQTLPLNMPHDDGSPYQCISAHAGNTALIDLDKLVDKGWLSRGERCQECGGSPSFARECLLNHAYYGFKLHATEHEKIEFTKFCIDKKFWLDDYALFIALRKEFNNLSWNQWPERYKSRNISALKEASRRLSTEIEAIKFEQFVFFTQWQELKDYAARHGVLLFGDIPIFVSYDSADVWVHPEVFKLDEQFEMSVVAGVPPDYFSETGQRWGNPHYNWSYLKKNGFHWWLDRIKTQVEMFDIIRIDHFRGLEAAWEIPVSEPTAINGCWIKAPGQALLKMIFDAFGPIALVAEDLGVITDKVEKLRDDFSLPGMKILQFAFSGGPSNPYLPANLDKNSVVYTGTHDNDTTLGWYRQISEQEQAYVYEYLGQPASSMPYTLIQTALASVANLAIIPMQDILELDTEHRMNIPGTTEGNWLWRFTWDQLLPLHSQRLARAIKLYGRD